MFVLYHKIVNVCSVRGEEYDINADMTAVI